LATQTDESQVSTHECYQIDPDFSACICLIIKGSTTSVIQLETPEKKLGDRLEGKGFSLTGYDLANKVSVQEVSA
jgi:hypothetical protein